MKMKYGIGHRESGSFLFKTIMVFAVLGVGMTLATRVGPGVYNYFLLRDLADRVVTEYATLSVGEVRRRVDYEMNRSNLSSDDIRVTKTPTGYRVEVDFRIPLVLKLGEKEFSFPGHEEWVLTYNVDS